MNHFIPDKGQFFEACEWPKRECENFANSFNATSFQLGLSDTQREKLKHDNMEVGR